MELDVGGKIIGMELSQATEFGIEKLIAESGAVKNC
jgi:hypothetical protein